MVEALTESHFKTQSLEYVCRLFTCFKPSGTIRSKRASIIHSLKNIFLSAAATQSLTLHYTWQDKWLHWELLRFTAALRQLQQRQKTCWKKQYEDRGKFTRLCGVIKFRSINPLIQPRHLRLKSLRQTWGLQGRFRIQFRRRGSSMMPSWCQCVMATHPSKSSTQVLLPIPRTDTPSRALVVPSSTLAAAWTFLKLILHFVYSLSCVLWERAVTVAVVVLSYISPPMLYLLCMSQWNPTPPVLRRDGGRPLPKNEHLLTGSIWSRECTPCWNVMPLDLAPPGRQGGWMDRRWGLASHLRRLEARQWSQRHQG